MTIFAFGVLFIALMLFPCIWTALTYKSIHERPDVVKRYQWHKSRPPLTDEEYLAMFDPPVSPEVAFGVREVLMDALGVDQDEVYPNSRLVEDLGAE